MPPTQALTEPLNGSMARRPAFNINKTSFRLSATEIIAPYNEKVVFTLFMLFHLIHHLKILNLVIKSIKEAFFTFFMYLFYKKYGDMIRLIISVLVLFLLAVELAGCASSKKNYGELRGLMLLENTQLGRNKGYYSKHKAKKISRGHRKIEKNRKFK
jgi:hypothetical protein